ncbi:MAG: helix-turn-helix domain-containing protein, partial [Paracoccaceae bacterium]
MLNAIVANNREKVLGDRLSFIALDGPEITSTSIGQTVMRTSDKPTRHASLVGKNEQTQAAGRPTGRVSKLDWLRKALEVFETNGIAAVRVVDLAQQLHVAKSGFYWHFKDRRDLLE